MSARAAWIISGLLLGCSTAAQIDLEAEVLSGAALIGITRGCDGEGFEGSLVLFNQAGGPVYVGSDALPTWPEDGHARITLSEVMVDGAAATIAVTASLIVQTQPETIFTLALDRSGVACGAPPEGPWGARCDLTPCGEPGAACDPARGCCPSGEVCVGEINGVTLTPRCVVEAEGCGGCAEGTACVAGVCQPRLFGPRDPQDAVVAGFAASAAALLDRDGGRLARWARGLWPIAFSGAGAQPLSGGPISHYADLETALSHDLLPPYGDARLLEGLAALSPEGPVLAWAFEPGPGVDLSGRPPHLFAVLDHPGLSAEADSAFAAAACQTGGAYLRYRGDSAALASIGLPVAARARCRLRLEIDPPPRPGARLQGRLSVRLTDAPLEATFDVILGGAPP
ncbi:hypothetical protein KKF91_20495 [Myxococcota bacterium]|nr:hypothetical protein [Myxococcota bacterium]MBU1432925.1 hypothetical protein [Myxococcota bacterium]MBU1899669.1 hypothetical protein [Myxococcota bacterium]